MLTELVGRWAWQPRPLSPRGAAPQHLEQLSQVPGKSQCFSKIPEVVVAGGGGGVLSFPLVAHFQFYSHSRFHDYLPISPFFTKFLFVGFIYQNFLWLLLLLWENIATIPASSQTKEVIPGYSQNCSPNCHSWRLFMPIACGPLKEVEWKIFSWLWERNFKKSVLY